MLRDGGVPAVVPSIYLPSVSQPATVNTSGFLSLWFLVLLKSPHPKGHPLVGTAVAEIAPVPSKQGDSLAVNGS